MAAVGCPVQSRRCAPVGGFGPTTDRGQPSSRYTVHPSAGSSLDLGSGPGGCQAHLAWHAGRPGHTSAGRSRSPHRTAGPGAPGGGRLQPARLQEDGGPNPGAYCGKKIDGGDRTCLYHSQGAPAAKPLCLARTLGWRLPFRLLATLFQAPLITVLKALLVAIDQVLLDNIAWGRADRAMRCRGRQRHRRDGTEGRTHRLSWCRMPAQPPIPRAHPRPTRSKHPARRTAVACTAGFVAHPMIRADRYSRPCSVLATGKQDVTSTA